MPNVKNGNEQPKNPELGDNAPFIEEELVPTLADFSIAQGGANVCEITVNMNDGHGDAVEKALVFNIWLSDDSDGAGLTGTSASGTVQAKSASGADFGVLTAKKALVVQSKVDGTYVLEITDSAKTGFYVGVQVPFSGMPAISRQLVSGDYGT